MITPTDIQDHTSQDIADKVNFYFQQLKGFPFAAVINGFFQFGIAIMETKFCSYPSTFLSPASLKKVHSEIRNNFSLTAQKREGGPGGWESKRHRSKIIFHLC